MQESELYNAYLHMQRSGDKLQEQHSVATYNANSVFLTWS